MRKVALAIAASLVLAVVAPAFSQPFADVPTDHWAFDAIAELAAKGIVEGYPDGTFKGDRAMTRYEMAMVVARLLARIEAIKIPAPAPPAKVPAPDVTRADITTLQRLINEFRAELAALGVRVTAVEEELAALRDRLDNVRVTGNTRLRYTLDKDTPAVTAVRNRFQFTGRLTPELTAVARARFELSAFVTPAANSAAAFDLSYFDWAGFYNTNWRVGRQQFTLGSNGLLFDGGDTATEYVDGARVNLAFGPLSLTTAVFRDALATLPISNLWMVSAGFNLLPGWTTRFHFYTERPESGAASNTGWEVDVSAGVIPGVTLGLDYATFTAAGGSSQPAYKASLTWDLGSMGGMAGFAPTLGVFYKNYGPNTPTVPFGPRYSNTEADYLGDYSWNMRSWGGTLGFTLNPQWSVSLAYESGECKVAVAAPSPSACTAAGAKWTETNAQLRYAIARGATLDFIYRTGTGESAIFATTAVASPRYRVELNFSW
jgi:hypothetical protein